MLTILPTATRVNAKTWRSRSRSSAIQLDLRYAIIALRVFAIYPDANLPTAPKPDAVATPLLYFSPNAWVFPSRG